LIVEVAWSTRDKSWSLWSDDWTPIARFAETEMLIDSKFAGRCRHCGRRWSPGQKIAWDPTTKITFCQVCVTNGVTGAKAAADALGNSAPPIETGGTLGDVTRAQSPFWKSQKPVATASTPLDRAVLDAFQKMFVEAAPPPAQPTTRDEIYAAMKRDPANAAFYQQQFHQLEAERQRQQVDAMRNQQNQRRTSKPPDDDPFQQVRFKGKPLMPDSWQQFLADEARAPKPAKKPAESKLTLALRALEEAILEKAGKALTPEMEKAWSKYQKLKEVVARPGSSNEGTVALKLALIEAVKLVF
jgi:hypothetical protein